ncbi:MAG: hypothetical protein IPO21_10940 [Bacteroidales bacterium]|nr:hypothetical protein [Bacteroidales bacterium]
MHKIIFALTVIFTFLSLNIFSQIENKRIYLDGNISFSNEDSDVTNNSPSNFYSFSSETKSTSKSFAVIPNIGYILNKNFIIGVGFKYSRESNYRKYDSKSTVRSRTPWDDSSVTSVTERTDKETYITNSNQIAPLLFIKYVKKLNKFINIGLKSGVAYGRETTHDIDSIVSSSSYNEYTFIRNNKFNSASLNIFLSPEIQLMVTDNVGLQLNFNMFNYTYFKSSNLFYLDSSSSEYDFSLKPSNWVMGVFFYLGNKKSSTND